MVIVKVGAGGQISLFNLFGTTDVVVDVLGWFPDNGSYVGLTPARLVDSRGSTQVAVRTPVAVCVALMTISDFDRRANRIIWNGRDFAEVPAMLRQAIPTVLGAYDDLAAAVPDLSVEARTLSEFTQAAASAAAGTATISELVSKILELPNLYEASAAGVALSAYAERNCGFSTGPQG
jgi:hypothetical protein